MAKTNRKGRSCTSRFVRLDYGLLDSEALHHLSPHSFRLLIAVWRRHNGTNNGEISYSVREGMALLNCGSDRARACFSELVDKGLLALTRSSNFDLKTHEARCWAITSERIGDKPPSRDFNK